MYKIDYGQASDVCKSEMPKAMSDWFDERINSGQAIKVNSGSSRPAYAMKSRDCTVVFYPSWNCTSQFKDIVNKLR